VVRRELRSRAQEVQHDSFSVNVNRFDPYKNFKFRVKWDGKVVAGISKSNPHRR
jgi:hypothetical protein